MCIDAEKQSFPPPKDKLGIKIADLFGGPGCLVPTRCLADDTATGDVSTCHSGNPGGGHIELHKPNPSTTGPSTPPDDITVCGSDDSGLGY